MLPSLNVARLDAGRTMYVEFFGIPRERAGTAGLQVEARSLGDLLGTLAARYPAFADLIDGAHLHRSIAANLNGDEFVSDPDTLLAPGDRLLILSSDVGG